MEGESSDKGMSGDVVQDVDDKVNIDDNEVIEPKVGMIFGDVEEVYELFRAYAKESGFPPRKRTSKKNDDGKLRSVTFACARGGNRLCTTTDPLRPQPNNQTGCKVKLTTSTNRDGQWRINSVFLEHNHGLSPRKASYFRCNCRIDHRARGQFEIGDISGIRVSKNYDSLVEVGGHENLTFLEKDCRNYVEKVRQLRLGEGDALTIQNYFLRMQAQNSNFFFCMDLDEDGRLKNVFWADGRSREAYKEFGDVVTFDTTYLTNKYDMPFAPFVGVNHHGQSILFGCGIISSEDTETFVWLFKTWRACMFDSDPTGIITDQDRAMQNAIQIVFPNTKHRWCLWHVMKKLHENFGSHKQFESICKTLQGLVYDAYGPEEFEQGWSIMLDTFDLHKNTWLSGLYTERYRWVPCFVKDSFWAGMLTTQRSESMNAFFDGYVNSKTTLKQFVEQYNHALREKEENENLADFKSFSQDVPCATCYGIEKQFQGVYTIQKFKEFQIELTGKMYCDIIGIREDAKATGYVIEETSCVGESSKKRCFTVTFQSDPCEINCSCQMFEFKGILCRHALLVLIKHKVTSVPAKYIIWRWRKDVLRSHTRVKINYDGKQTTDDQLRYEKMCLQFTKVADLAAGDEGSSTYIMEWLDTQQRELYSKRYKTQDIQISNAATKSINLETKASGTVKDPKVKKFKGAPRKNRLQSSLKKNSKKSNRKAPSNGIVQEGQPREQVPVPQKARNNNRNVSFIENVHVGPSTNPAPSQLVGLDSMQESVVLSQTITSGSPYIPLGYGITSEDPFWGVNQRPNPTYSQDQFMDPARQSLNSLYDLNTPPTWHL